MQQQEIYTASPRSSTTYLTTTPLVLTPALTAAEVPEWDSFNHINLIVAVESRLQYQVPDRRA